MKSSHGQVAPLIVTAIVFLTTVAWLSTRVPPNNDEVIQYKPLACWSHAGAKYNVYNAGCTSYPATIFGVRFNRSYDYIGLTSSLLYAPMYWIYPHITSHYFVGILAIVVFSVLMARMLDLPLIAAFVPLTYFPLSFQIIHDTGPITVSILSYPVLMYATTKMLRAGPSRLTLALSGAVVLVTVALATEDKPFYVYLIPQILCIVVYGAWHKQQRDDVIAGRLMAVATTGLLVTCLVALGVASVLLLVKTDNEAYVWRLIRRAGGSPLTVSQFGVMCEFMASPISFAHRIFDIPSTFKVLSIIEFVPLVGIAMFFVGSRVWRDLLILTMANVLLIGAFIVTNNAYAGHHFIFLHLPIIIALMTFASQSPRRLGCTLTWLSLIAVSSMILLSMSQIPSQSSRDRAKVLRYLARPDIARGTVINVSSWGAYYLALLYGDPSRIVVQFAETDYDEPQPAPEVIRSLLTRTGREAVVNMCNMCTLDSVEELYPGFHVEQVGPRNLTWSLWRVTTR